MTRWEKAYERFVIYLGGVVILAGLYHASYQAERAARPDPSYQAEGPCFLDLCVSVPDYMEDPE